MVDHKKRTTLQVMTAAATIAAVPAAISAASAAAPATVHSDISPVVEHLQTHMSGLGLRIEVEPTASKPSMWVRFTNVYDKPVQLKHVSPGLIRSDGKLYDINAALTGQTLEINSGEAYSYMIQPIDNELDALVHKPDSKISQLMATVTGPNPPTQGDVLTPRLILS